MSTARGDTETDTETETETDAEGGRESKREWERQKERQREIVIERETKMCKKSTVVPKGPQESSTLVPE